MVRLCDNRRFLNMCILYDHTPGSSTTSSGAYIQNAKMIKSMHDTVILDCRLTCHDSARRDCHPSIKMKGNCAMTAASVIKVRSYTVYSLTTPSAHMRSHTRSRSGATVEISQERFWTVRNGIERWEIGWSQSEITVDLFLTHGGLTGYAQMVTQFHTLSHFSTQNHTRHTHTTYAAGPIRRPCFTLGSVNHTY